MKIAAICLIVAAFLLAATSVQMSADAQWYDTSRRGPMGPLVNASTNAMRVCSATGTVSI